VLQKICSNDNSYWESDVSQVFGLSNFEDVIEARFAKPSPNKEGSIIVKAINTDFSNAVFKNMFEFLGDQSLAFMQAVEHDSELIGTLRRWTEESSLKAFLWDGKQWNNIGTIHPEASVTPFSKLIRFNIGHVSGDTVRIRLTCMADVWKIDAVQVDWTPVRPLKSMPVRLVSAVGPEHNDVSSALAFADKEYVTLLPPEEIELTFQAAAPSSGKKVAYAVSAQGYLYEWMPENREQTVSSQKVLVPRERRISYLKTLLQHKSIFLPPIYADWIQMKNGKRVTSSTQKQ
jgi:hypothetical protein